MTATGPGHVFVTRGLIEKFACDALVVPTDDDFLVEDWFWPAVGVESESELEQRKPARWPSRGHGRARGREDLWFVDVGDRSVRRICRSLTSTLKDIQRTLGPPLNGRERLLVVLPILGIGKGGREPGEMIEALLEAAWSVAGVPGGLDVAFVARDGRPYAAAQHVRRTSPRWTLAAEEQAAARDLGRKAVRGELATFMGAGVSIPAGLPTWKSLLSMAVEAIPGTNHRGLNLLDLAELVQRRAPHALRAAVQRACRTKRHALGHALVQSLGCRENVTTNFDTCFEQSVVEDDLTLLSEQPVSRGRWLLKMHGTVTDPDSIVLTRGDFARYDKQYRSAGAVLQTLVRTRHVLFVGVSLEDDNVLRLVHEVPRAGNERWGTVVYLGDDNGKRALYGDELDWLAMPAGELSAGARRTEVFLDMVGAYSSIDVPWLLDPRFRKLLRTPERGVVRDLERVAARVAQLADRDGDRWQPVLTQLQAAGWSSADPAAPR